jgi:hypothetical protein
MVDMWTLPIVYTTTRKRVEEKTVTRCKWLICAKYNISLILFINSSITAEL